MIKSDLQLLYNSLKFEKGQQWPLDSSLAMIYLNFEFHTYLLFFNTNKNGKILYCN